MFTLSLLSEIIAEGWGAYIAVQWSVMSNSGMLWTAAHWASLFCTVFGIGSNSCPLSQWCHLTILSSVAPFASCPQSFPASGSFPVRQRFISGGHRIGTLASTSGFLMIIQGRFRLGLTGLISLLSKRLSIAFTCTRVWKHQFFGAQPSLWPNSNVHTCQLEKPKQKHSFDYTDLCWKSDVSYQVEDVHFYS